MMFGFRRTIEQVSNLLIILSSIVLFSLMVLTVIDVFGRFFGIPVPGATGIIGVGLSIAIALALPVVNWRDANIVLGIFKGSENSIWGKLRRVFVALTSAITIVTLTYIMFFHAKSAAKYEDVIGYLDIPLAPTVYLFSAMAAFTAGISILNLFGVHRLSSYEEETDGSN